jgi:hypothetical protein
LIMVLEKISGVRDYSSLCKLLAQSGLMFINKGEIGSRFVIRLKEMNRTLETEALGWTPSEFIAKLRHGIGNYITGLTKDAKGNMDFQYVNSPYHAWITSIEGEERICNREIDLPTLEESLTVFEKGRTKQFLEGGVKQNTNPNTNGEPKPVLSLETKANKQQRQKPLTVNSEGKVTQTTKVNPKEGEGPTMKDLSKAGICFHFTKGECRFGENCRFKHEKYDPAKTVFVTEKAQGEAKIDRHGYGLFNITVPVANLGSDIGSDISLRSDIKGDIIRVGVRADRKNNEGEDPHVSQTCTNIDTIDRKIQHQATGALTQGIGALWGILKQGSPMVPLSRPANRTQVSLGAVPLLRVESPTPAPTLTVLEAPDKTIARGAINTSSLPHLSSTSIHDSLGIYLGGKGRGGKEWVHGLDIHRIPALDTGAAVSIDMDFVLGDRNMKTGRVEMHTAQGGASMFTDSILDRPYVSNVAGKGGGGSMDR